MVVFSTCFLELYLQYPKILLPEWPKMGDQLIASVVTVATAIVGLAIIAVLVSNKASTANVIKAGASGFAQDLSAATNPFSSSSGFSAPAGFQTS
jgi:hypothetical protein